MSKRDGAKLVIGGEELVVPPLNLSTIMKVGEQLDVLSDASKHPRSKVLAASTEIIVAAIQANHPTVTREWILENVEFQDIDPLLLAVMNASNFREHKGPKAESPAP